MKIRFKLIVVLLTILFIVFGTILFLKIKNNVISNNINNIEWLSKNVSIEENTKIGNNINYVKTKKYVNIFNINYQTVVNDKIDELIQKNDYTMDNPLVIYNAYGTNILSLNVYFESENLGYIEYVIHVSDDIGDFSKTLYNDGIDNLTKQHRYQIIGFVPGYKNILTLKLKDENNRIIKEKEICVDLTNVEINSQIKLETEDGNSKEELSNGLYTILGNDSDESDYIALYDNNGIIRSEMPIIGYRAHSILFKDNLMYYSISQTKIVAVDNKGKINQIYKTGYYYLHHDYIFDDDGDLLVLANNTKKNTEEDCIIKINLQTKEVTEVIDFEKMFKSYVDTCELDTESVRDEGEDGLDWLHLNSIEYINGDVILSSRETSSIIKIKDIEENPSLEYILSSKKIWEDTEFSKYVYDQLGDFKIHAGQHYVRYLKSESEGVYYLSFYNNNYGKQTSKPDFDYSTIGITNTNAFSGDESYYYVYKVDENNKTFSLTSSFNVEYSGIVSSADVKENGNIIMDSGTKGIFAEYDSNYNLIKKFNIDLNKYMVYRVLKYNFNDFWFK